MDEFTRARDFIDGRPGGERTETARRLQVLGPFLFQATQDCDFRENGDLRPSLLTSRRKKSDQFWSG